MLHDYYSSVNNSLLIPMKFARIYLRYICSHVQPLCGIDPMLVLEFSMLILKICPTQTIDLFLSGNIPSDLVNSYLKQHAPSLQATYLEHIISINENGISQNLQNEMVTIPCFYTTISRCKFWLNILMILFCSCKSIFQKFLIGILI